MLLPRIFRSPKLTKTILPLAAGLALIGVLAACGANYYPAKGDNKPHPGVARAHSLPIHGIDVSRHQGNIDWRAVAQAGTRFAYIKATDGGDYLDPNFRSNWEQARAAGIPRGAYHFVYWCRPASEQVAWFAANVPAEADALPPVLDLEWNNGSSCKHSLSREEVLEKVRVLLAGMEAHTGKVPVIYTDINFHRDVLEGVQIDNPMWLRSTAAQPHERFSNRPFTFWQYTQTGTVPGIRTEVDRNAWYGSESDWIQFFLTGCDPRTYMRLAGQGRCAPLK
ncbi:MAG: GH25 family lysozyme [Pelagibacterium sp.]|jgi:lysozyme|uniref:glycoside hydrolase family 25 protein n=1 Tax=Pelagibacterium sp. TaxID=1967288 RepID=UPI0032EC8250|tara:strand:- start:1609 stop:2448 length:840 start_codon:yes stop_codon:yes gene_type:complete